jgi:hypothetical protein
MITIISNGMFVMTIHQFHQKRANNKLTLFMLLKIAMS